MKQLWAKFVVGLYLIAHFIRKGYRALQSLRGKQGLSPLEAFDRNFREDHIATLSDEETLWISQLNRCIRCGLCDSLCEPASLIPAMCGPSHLAHGQSRDLSRSVQALPLADHIRACTSCHDCLSVCPTGVKIEPLVKLIQRHAAKTNAA